MRYLVQAFDARHNWLDTDSRADGWHTEIDGPGPMLDFLAATKTGLLLDVDTDTRTAKRIAYWVISVDGIAREVYTTTWGQHCNVKTKDYGPGCHAPQPVPAAR
jgi:hypothetical protein